MVKKCAYWTQGISIAILVFPRAESAPLVCSTNILWVCQVAEDDEKKVSFRCKGKLDDRDSRIVFFFLQGNRKPISEDESTMMKLLRSSVAMAIMAYKKPHWHVAFCLPRMVCDRSWLWRRLRFASGENLSLTDLPDTWPRFVSLKIVAFCIFWQRLSSHLVDLVAYTAIVAGPAELTAQPPQHYNSPEREASLGFKDCADAGGGEPGRLWELEQLLRQLWRGRARGRAPETPETLRWMEDFGAEQCRELQLSLGPWAETFLGGDGGGNFGVSRTQKSLEFHGILRLWILWMMTSTVNIVRMDLLPKSVPACVAIWGRGACMHMHALRRKFWHPKMFGGLVLYVDHQDWVGSHWAWPDIYGLYGHFGCKFPGQISNTQSVETFQFWFPSCSGGPSLLQIAFVQFQ